MTNLPIPVTKQQRTLLRAAAVIAEYSYGLRSAECYGSGPNKGRTDHEIWREILQYRALVASLIEMARPQ